MILANYSQFRSFFALAGASIDADGFLHFPGPQLSDGSVDLTPALSLSHSVLRKNSFGVAPTASSVATTAGAKVFTLTAGPVGPLINPSLLSPGDVVFPLIVSTNVAVPAGGGYGAPDAVPGTHDYDCFLSQRRDPGLYPHVSGPPTYWNSQPFVVSLPDPMRSGTIQIALNMAEVSKLLPGLAGTQLATPNSLTLLFRRCALYWKRRSDNAIGWIRLAPESY